MLPGVATPSEIEVALGRGLTLLKFFPAGPFGGVATLQAYAGPYAQLRFVPTGGISASNLAAYLAVPAVVACGGSWMVRRELLVARDFAAVTRLAAEAAAIVRQVRESRSNQEAAG